MWFSPAAWAVGSPTCPGSHRNRDRSLPASALSAWPTEEKAFAPESWFSCPQSANFPNGTDTSSHQVLLRSQRTQIGSEAKEHFAQVHPGPCSRPSNGLDLGPHLDAVFLVGHRGHVIPATRWRLILGLFDLAWSEVEENAPVCQGDSSPWGTDVCICSSCPLSFGCCRHEAASARVPSRWAWV